MADIISPTSGRVRDRSGHGLAVLQSLAPPAMSDPAGLGRATGSVAAALLLNPWKAVGPVARYGVDVLEATVAAGTRALGRSSGAGPIEPGKDRRFAHAAWSESPVFWLFRQRYLLLERMVAELLESSGRDPVTRAKAAFVFGQAVDALAPTNNPMTNPAVLTRLLETGGMSLVRGTRQFLDDLATNGGRPRQVPPGVLEVGRDLAATPGKVVFRSRLMELIQYEPQTEQVHEVPLLLSPPWINKYYIMDLAPGRSFVEWAVRHGHTVFVISYRNPDAEMRDVGLDDYLLGGPITALDVIREITGADRANLVGLCLGGTLTMALLAYLNAVGDRRVATATFLNTLVDFSEPGVLGIFTDEKTVGKVTAQMERAGYLSGRNMRTTFELLRSNDLLWHYVVNNWLLGERPPVFDLLAWNSDSTRMPARMHSFYLRSCYLDNELAQGRMELAGQRLDVAAVDEELYFVGAEADHIAPWRSAYRGARIPAGRVRFVLSDAGHIAGIVNPPGGRSVHWASDTDSLPADADAWLRGATRVPASWWQDWATWIGPRSGSLRPPPPIGSETYPQLDDAPGRYVRE